MHPEQSQTSPSPAEQPSDATAPDTVSAEQAEVDASPSWWRRLFSRQPAEEPRPSDQEPSSAEAPSGKLVLSEEELQKRVQSEVDRREAKRQREERDAARKKLRDEDPWAYAEQDRQAETAQQSESQVGQLFADIGSHHDRATLDPLVMSLPEQERQRILGLEGAGVGLDGRKLVVTEALKSLEKHWKAEGEREAETKLRKNSAFRKQVFAEFRGQYPEPELLPSGSTRSNGRSSDDINNMFRAQVGLRTSE